MTDLADAAIFSAGFLRRRSSKLRMPSSDLIATTSRSVCGMVLRQLASAQILVQVASGDGWLLYRYDNARLDAFLDLVRGYL